MKQQDAIVKKVTSLSNVANPVVHVKPVETKGDITLMLKKKSIEAGTSSVFDVSDNTKNSGSSGSSSKKPASAAANVNTKQPKTLLTFAMDSPSNSSSSASATPSEKNAPSAGSHTSEVWKMHNPNEHNVRKQASMTLVVESIPSIKLKDMSPLQ